MHIVRPSQTAKEMTTCSQTAPGGQDRMPAVAPVLREERKAMVRNFSRRIVVLQSARAASELSRRNRPRAKIRHIKSILRRDDAELKEHVGYVSSSFDPQGRTDRGALPLCKSLVALACRLPWWSKGCRAGTWLARASEKSNRLKKMFLIRLAKHVRLFNARAVPSGHLFSSKFESRTSVRHFVAHSPDDQATYRNSRAPRQIGSGWEVSDGVA